MNDSRDPQKRNVLHRIGLVCAPFLTALIPVASAQVLANSQLTESGHLINVLDHAPAGSAACQGNSTTDTAALQGALAKARSTPGMVVYMPACRYAITVSRGSPIAIPTHTTLRGAGQGRTIIVWNDDEGNNLLTADVTSGSRAAEIAIEDLTVRGTWDTRGNAGAYPIIPYGVDSLTIRRVTSEYSRAFGIAARGSTEVTVTDSAVRYAGRDGINVAQCSGVMISNNVIEHVDDDAIGVHSDIYDPWKVRRNLIIIANRIFDAQGVKVLGARQATIIGNVLDVVRSQGIAVNTVATGLGQEGVSAAIGIAIANNIITNVIDRRHIDNLNQNAPGILVSGSSAHAGGYAAIPGEADASTGTIINPYPELLANSKSANVPTPGSFGVAITGNVIARTLPPTDSTDKRYGKWSDLGHGQIFTRNGWLDPSLTESDMSGTAITIGPGVVRDVMIANNVIRGQRIGFSFGGTRLDNIVFRGNLLSDIRDYGVLSTSATQRVYVEGNLIDMDPFHRHPNRGPHGTWRVHGGPTAFDNEGRGAGVIVRQNTIRNVNRDSDMDTSAPGQAWWFDDNVIEADPIIVGHFSPSNKGVGIVRTSAGFRLTQTDSDPASAAYGQILTIPVTVANKIPSNGKWLQGAFVRNSAPRRGNLVITGWLRLTTGITHVLGTDWLPIAISTTGTGPLGTPRARQLPMNADRKATNRVRRLRSDRHRQHCSSRCGDRVGEIASPSLCRAVPKDLV